MGQMWPLCQALDTLLRVSKLSQDLLYLYLERLIYRVDKVICISARVMQVQMYT